jgi:hypothetical protein
VPAGNDPPQEYVVFPERHSQRGADTGKVDGFLVGRVVQLRLIGNVNKTSPINQQSRRDLEKAVKVSHLSIVVPPSTHLSGHPEHKRVHR